MEVVRFINKHNNKLIRSIKNATDRKIVETIWWIEDNTDITKEDIKIEKIKI